MTNINRRTVLKGVTASSAAVLGLGGAATTLADPEGNQGPPNDNPNDDGGPSQDTEKNECRPPNVQLAKYEWIEEDATDRRDSRTEYVNCEDGAFVIEEGDSSLVWPTLVECDDDHEPVYVEWESSVPVCFASVKHGTEIDEVNGGIRSGVIDLDDFDVSRFAFSNIIFCERPAQAILCEDTDYGLFESHMHIPGDSGQENAVQVTSHTDPTSDYASGTVNIAKFGLTLDDIKGDTLTYDFKEGSNNRNALPDEVFLVLETPDQISDNTNPGNNDFTVAYRTSNLDPTEFNDWEMRDVTADMDNTTPAELVNHQWHILATDDAPGFDLLAKPEDIYPPFTPDFSGIIQFAGSLRDNPESKTNNLFDAFNPNTRILGVGFGYGFTTEQKVLDAFFDDLVVNGEDPLDFPAAIPMDPTFDDDDPIKVTLEFEEDESNVSADNVVPESVKLNTLWRAAPPTAQGVPATEVSTSGGPIGGTITAKFPQSEVDTLFGGDASTNTAIVSGDFDLPQVISFVATGEVK